MKVTQLKQKAERQNIRTIVTPPRKTIAVDVNGRLFECRTLPAVKAILFNDIIAAFAPALEIAVRPGQPEGEAEGAMIRVSLGLFYGHAEQFARFVAGCTGADYAEIAELDAEALKGLADACLEANESLFFAREIRALLVAFSPAESESTTSLNNSEPTAGE